MTNVCDIERGRSVELTNSVLTIDMPVTVETAPQMRGLLGSRFVHHLVSRIPVARRDCSQSCGLAIKIALATLPLVLPAMCITFAAYYLNNPEAFKSLSFFGYVHSQFSRS